MNRRRSGQLLMALLSCSLGCRLFPDTDGASDTGGRVLDCPGDAQCPPEDGTCPEGLVLGPNGACTNTCRTDRDCTSGVAGELCYPHVWICGVACDVELPDGGCGSSGMPGAVCMSVMGSNVCGYP